jgi:hypothetical protein
MGNSSNFQVAFEREQTNFLPSLSFGTKLNIGLLDVTFKIVGDAVTFGLIIIALRESLRGNLDTERFCRYISIRSRLQFTISVCAQ